MYVFHICKKRVTYYLNNCNIMSFFCDIYKIRKFEKYSVRTKPLISNTYSCKKNHFSNTSSYQMSKQKKTKH